MDQSIMLASQKNLDKQNCAIMKVLLLKVKEATLV